MGGCAVGTGVGYEWLAVDGTPGNRVCTGNRTVMDRDRTVSGNSLQLGVYFFTTDTIRANNSLTLPAYFENRFRDKKRVLLLVSSIVIVIFFLVYTASALSAGGKLFNSVFGVDYHIALAIGAVVILAYTFMGGFLAVCVPDFIQGSLMLVGLLMVPIAAYFMVGADQVKPILDQSGVVGGASAYLSLFRNGDRSYTAVEIISQLAWGLGYCGMPHILTRFMAGAQGNMFMNR